jgi:cytochrome c-type biogenesis protein CcmH/NrfG
MTRDYQNSRFARFAIGSALAVAMVAGTAGASQLAFADSGVRNASSKQTAKAIAAAEKAVVKHPRDAVLRVALAQAYLGAGRFESAADAYADALSLGDARATTALGLALSQIG